MDTLELKNILISKISEIDDIQYLEAIMTILESKTSSKNYSENYNEELLKAEEDIKAGRLYTQSQAKDKIEEWKKK